MALNPVIRSHNVSYLYKWNLGVLFLVNFCHGFGLSLLSACLQPYIYNITKSELMLGYIVSAAYFFQFAPMSITGKMSDRWGRKTMLLLGLLFIGIGLTFLWIRENLAFILMGVVSLYLGIAMFDPSLQIFTNENIGIKKQGFWFGLMFFVYSGGSIFSNTLISSLGPSFSAQFYFQLYFVVVLFEIFIVLIFSHRISIPSSIVKSPLKISKPISLWRLILLNPVFRIVLIFFTMDAFIWGFSVSLYNGSLVANLGLTKEQLALILAVLNTSILLLQIPAGKLMDIWGKKKCLVTSEISGIVFFIINIVVFFLPTSVRLLTLGISEFFLAISIVLFVPAQFSAITNLDPARKAEAYGIISMVKGLAFMPMGIIQGALIQYVSYLAPFVITLIGIPFEIWFLLRNFDKLTVTNVNPNITSSSH